MSQKELTIRICNVLSYISVLEISRLHLPSFGYDSSLRPVPIFMQFLWWATSVLLGGFVIYQWFPTALTALEAVAWWYVIASLILAIFLKFMHVAWSSHFTLLVVTGLCITIFQAYKRVHLLNLESYSDKLFVRAAFSLFYTWSVIESVVLAVSVFEYTLPQAWQIFNVAGAITIAVMSWGSVKFFNDYIAWSVLIGSLVMAWLKEHDIIISWSLLGCAIIALLIVGWPKLRREWVRRQDIGAPLLV
ncbi:uncharacterized protein VTP21DRAFT_2555 [Calcarisporiella thermophila]|uniref:uncharacterized protein n=1 Tax=Calcarisporiella thermophila TaxID=911321 RepID=UPI00374444B6